MIKNVYEGQHSDTVLLGTHPLTGIIQCQIKEGKSLELNCATMICRTLRAAKRKCYLHN